MIPFLHAKSSIVVPQIPSLKLYRKILKTIPKLPQEAQNYYFVYAKREFITYKSEDDQDNVNHLVNVGKYSLKFIKKKYDIELDEDEEQDEDEAENPFGG